MTERADQGFLSWPVIAVVGFVSLIHSVWWVTGDQIVSHGGFADGDSYLRLLRVERLIETWNWFDISVPDANAPFGTTLHWTRLFDLVLLVIAGPMVPFLGFTKALFWAGVIVSPLIHIVSAGALAWAMLPVFGRAGACVAAALSASQAGILAFSFVGHADHHMLFVLFTVLTLGFISRVLIASESLSSSARAAGACLAMGIWVGPENIVFLSLCLATLGMPWLLAETGSGRKNLAVAQGLAGGVFVALLIERGSSGFFDVEYDRLSVIHLAFSVLLLAFWALVDSVNRAWSEALRPLTRVALAFGGIVLMATVLVLLFPKITGNPLNDADPAIQPIYQRISEYRAIAGVDRFLIYFGSLLFVGPWLVWKLKTEWPRRQFWAWVLLALGTVAYAAFGLNWLRWSLYAALFMSIVLADLIVAADRQINLKFKFPRRVVIKVIVVVGLSVGPMFSGALILNAGKTDAERAAAKTDACPIIDLSTFLNSKPWSDRSRIIDASANFGAEIIYRTDHQALATVHHRNVSGILDGQRILNLTDEKAIKSLIRKRRVDLILLCPGSGDDSYFLMGPEDEKPKRFYSRLVGGQYPSWVTPVKLPAPIKNKFLLFEVTHPL